MRVGIVANVEDPEAGFVQERFEHLGASFVRRWRSDPGSLSGFERDVDLIVLLGSDWSVFDPAFAAEVAAERDLVVRATASGCPTLGICFGGQLVASALGCEVTRADPGEIGWVNLTSSRPDLFGAGPWFAYHLDRWHDRPEHPAIAVNDAGPQAVVERRTLGVQFHPEVTGEVIDRWVTHGGRDLEVVGADRARIARETVASIDGARERCHALVDAFLDVVASAGGALTGRSVGLDLRPRWPDPAHRGS